MANSIEQEKKNQKEISKWKLKKHMYYSMTKSSQKQD